MAETLRKTYPKRTSTAKNPVPTRDPPVKLKVPKPVPKIDALDLLHDQTVKSLSGEPRLPPPKGCYDVQLTFSDAIDEDPDVPREFSEFSYQLPQTPFHAKWLNHEEILDRPPELIDLTQFSLIRLPSYSGVPLYGDSGLASTAEIEKLIVAKDSIELNEKQQEFDDSHKETALMIKQMEEDHAKQQARLKQRQLIHQKIASKHPQTSVREDLKNTLLKMRGMQDKMKTIGAMLNSDPMMPRRKRVYPFPASYQSSMEPQPGPSSAFKENQDQKMKEQHTWTSEEVIRNLSSQKPSGRRIENKKKMPLIDYGKKPSVQPKSAKVQSGWSY
jgi:hypothetical protein